MRDYQPRKVDFNQPMFFTFISKPVNIVIPSSVEIHLTVNLSLKILP